MIGKVFQITLGICGVAIAAQAAQAQTAAPHAIALDKFQYLSAQDWKAKLGEPGSGPATAIVSDHESYFVEFVARAASGEFEQHTHWTDYISILSGEAALTYGGTVTGARQTGPGEMLGGANADGVTITLHPGDYIEIPAGVPHRMVVQPGLAVRYLVFKARV